jgi:hypothetical protein
MKNGVAVLDEPVNLPDGTPVLVDVGGDFWRGKSIDELMREQGIHGPPNLSHFAGAWPQDESLDEFLEFIREARR